MSAAVTVFLLTRPTVGLFTTSKTSQNVFNKERYQFKSSKHYVALGILTVLIFFTILLLSVFAADTYLM